MEDHEYLACQQELMALAAGMSVLDLEGFLERLRQSRDRCMSEDAELWKRACGNITALIALAEAALRFQQTTRDAYGPDIHSEGMAYTARPTGS